MIYFIQAVGINLVKIGRTKKPIAERLAALQISSPVHLELLATMPGGKSVERSLHRQFAYARSHGEWFYPVRALLQYIDEVYPASRSQEEQDKTKEEKLNARHQRRFQHALTWLRERGGQATLRDVYSIRLLGARTPGAALEVFEQLSAAGYGQIVRHKYPTNGKTVTCFHLHEDVKGENG